MRARDLRYTEVNDFWDESQLIRSIRDPHTKYWVMYRKKGTPYYDIVYYPTNRLPRGVLLDTYMGRLDRLELAVALTGFVEATEKVTP